MVRLHRRGRDAGGDLRDAGYVPPARRSRAARGTARFREPHRCARRCRKARIRAPEARRIGAARDARRALDAAARGRPLRHRRAEGLHGRGRSRLGLHDGDGGRHACGHTTSSRGFPSGRHGRSGPLRVFPSGRHGRSGSRVFGSRAVLQPRLRDPSVTAGERARPGDDWPVGPPGRRMPDRTVHGPSPFRS